MLGAELGAQPANVHIDRPGATEEVVSPHLGDQLLPGEDPARVLGEELEQLEFLVRQLQRTAPQSGRVGVLLDREVTQAGELVIDEHSYSAKLRGRPLDLTYKEFELLKYLAQHPGRVFSRAQLLQEIWGYDYFGGTRTVDVHVRRLRAKLGPEYDVLIGTVRNVGYRFVPEADPREDDDALTSV